MRSRRLANSNEERDVGHTVSPNHKSLWAVVKLLQLNFHRLYQLYLIIKPLQHEPEHINTGAREHSSPCKHGHSYGRHMNTLEHSISEIWVNPTESVSWMVDESLVTASLTFPNCLRTPAALRADVLEALGRSASMVKKSRKSGSIRKSLCATVRFIYLCSKIRSGWKQPIEWKTTNNNLTSPIQTKWCHGNMNPSKDSYNKLMMMIHWPSVPLMKVKGSANKLLLYEFLAKRVKKFLWEHWQSWKSIWHVKFDDV